MFSLQPVQEQQLVYMHDYKITLLFILLVQNTDFSIFDLYIGAWFL